MSEPIGPHVVVRERPLGVDAHGDPVEGQGDLETIEGCYVLPRSSDEAQGRAGTIIVGLTLYAPADSDVLATDLIRWEGTTYRVEGRPGRYDWPDGAGAVLQAALEEVVG